MSVEGLFTPVHRRHVEWLRRLPVSIDQQGMRIGGQYVMFFAEAELMRLHAAGLLAGRPAGDVLEVGLGLGVFAEQAASIGMASYTAIEAHRGVADLTRASVLDRLGVPVTVHARPWQLTELPQASFDAIMYDTWPPDGLADEDFARFVEHVALPCLRPGGRFSFFWSGSAVSGRRVEILNGAFPGWTARRYTLPDDCVPAGWTKPTRDFVIPIAVKGDG